MNSPNPSNHRRRVGDKPDASLPTNRPLRPAERLVRLAALLEELKAAQKSDAAKIVALEARIREEAAVLRDVPPIDDAEIEAIVPVRFLFPFLG